MGAREVDRTKLMLRKAEPSDSAKVFEWRNHPDVRRYFFDAKPLERASHERWFAGVLKNPTRHFFIAVNEAGEGVGVLRLDESPDGQCAEVDIYVAPGQHGKGWGLRILNEGALWARANTRLTRLQARVIVENTASLKVFAKSGFRPVYQVFEKNLKEAVPVE